jgi:CheY-like chemotaxis protein
MNAKPLRILIVDDHADSARMLALVLKMEGHEAKVVFDGPTAIAAANVQKPDVVLLDISLPGMSGIEVAAELRRNPEQAQCVLVALTGHSIESLPSPSPFDRYFEKPVGIDSLRAYFSEIQASHKRPSPTQAVA